MLLDLHGDLPTSNIFVITAVHNGVSHSVTHTFGHDLGQALTLITLGIVQHTVILTVRSLR